MAPGRHPLRGSIAQRPLSPRHNLGGRETTRGTPAKNTPWEPATVTRPDFILSDPPEAHYCPIPVVLIEAAVTMLLAGFAKAQDLSALPSSKTGN